MSAMRVLHVVAADRWTGAAASALQLVEAEREAGIDSVLAFRAGHNLAERLAGRDWALPVLRKERTLADLRASCATLRSLAAGRDLVHAHLPHDHALARLALARLPLPLVRSLRRDRHLRPDPFHRWLMRKTAGVALANSTMAPLVDRFPSQRGLPRGLLPPAVERRFRRPLGTPIRAYSRRSGRAALGLPADAVVVGAVGKLERDRGHDLLLRAVAATPGIRALIVGHGSAGTALRALAVKLGAGERVVFAGYVDAGLEDLYPAMDLFAFPAPGSDHGHRAIVEASGSCLPTLAADVPGVRDLVEPGVTGELYPREDAAALAVLLREWSASETRRTRAAEAVARRAASWTPAELAAASLALYCRCL
jgi:glycosyltransferase involved in cell wall biosynthesis